MPDRIYDNKNNNMLVLNMKEKQNINVASVQRITQLKDKSKLQTHFVFVCCVFCFNTHSFFFYRLLSNLNGKALNLKGYY